VQKVAVIYREPLRPKALDTLIEQVRGGIAPHCHGVTLHVRSRDLPEGIIASGGLDPTLAAALVVWIGQTETLATLEPALDVLGPVRATYLLVESVMKEYARIDWPEGTRSPGATLLALLKRRAGLSVAEFHERWQAHSRLSLEFHPLTRYHRSAVARQVGREQPDCDGIVEERIGSIKDLEPGHFYRGEQARERAIASLEGYVDLAAGGLTCGLMDEYLIRRPAWL
jgi:hypothetical protein